MDCILQKMRGEARLEVVSLTHFLVPYQRLVILIILPDCLSLIIAVYTWIQRINQERKVKAGGMDATDYVQH